MVGCQGETLRPKYRHRYYNQTEKLLFCARTYYFLFLIQGNAIIAETSVLMTLHQIFFLYIVYEKRAQISVRQHVRPVFAVPVFASFLAICYKQLHTFRLGIRKRVLAAKVKIIPASLFILRVAGIRNRLLVEDILILRQNVIRDNKHVMLNRKLSNMQSGILSNCVSVIRIDSWVHLRIHIFS